MRPHTQVDVVWDGVRVYRVPSPGEIEALLLLSEGNNSLTASRMLGLAAKDGARRRIVEVQHKVHALSPAAALYQLYRLQVVRHARMRHLAPVLSSEQASLLEAMVHLGLPYDRAHKVLGVGQTTLTRHMAEIKRLLVAANRVQCLRRAVEHGDIEIRRPNQLWRGLV